MRLSNFRVHHGTVFDIEVFPGWFEVGFMTPAGEVHQYVNDARLIREALEYIRGTGSPLVGFNSRSYDDLVLTRYLNEDAPDAAYELSVNLIQNDHSPYQYDNAIQSIDLMPVLPGRMSLKRLGVCLGHERLQELPIPYDRTPSPEEQRILLGYNRNDLEITRKLYEHLMPDLELRQAMSDQYGVDLRSRGEAALAEQVLLQALPGANRKALNEEAVRYIEDYPLLHVRQPAWWDILVTEPRMRALGESIFAMSVSAASGRMPRDALNRRVFIDDRYYQMGVGGLHSIDGPGAWIPAEDEVLLDLDVGSYYPNIILTQRLYPRAWGEQFLDIYRGIVERRMKAKREGDKTTAAILKISANGTYGKSSDLFSALYDPQVTINVTVLGQLALLALIQMLEGVAIVCSANTDGITVLVKRSRLEQLETIAARWEEATQLNLERVDYRALYQSNVNNYVAVKTNGEIKAKGRFQDKWPNLRGMPNANVVATAVKRRAAEGTSLTETIYGCRDINQFLLTQNVNSDWTTTWNDKPQGNILRFYKSNSPQAAPIVRTPGAGAKGNQGNVPNSEHCIPVADLPREFPSDINHAWYISEAEKLWESISRPKRPGFNRWAEVFARRGLRPCMVNPAAPPSRARAIYAEDDFASLPPGWAIGTGTGEGLLGRVHNATGHVEVFAVDQPYPSRTRAKVSKDHGFVQYYSARIPLNGVAVTPRRTEEDLDQFYTSGELDKAREAKREEDTDPNSR